MDNSIACPDGYVDAQDLTTLAAWEGAGLIAIRTDPRDPSLRLYNYMPKQQFRGSWGPLMRLCRGLIVQLLPEEGRAKIIARPPAKFFNLGEKPAMEISFLTNPHFQVSDKVDGSLGIGYFRPDGQFAVATRGSFSSSQAQHALALVQRRYPTVLTQLNRQWTYWFEIVYPQNKIVVNYGELDDLFLIGAIETASGIEIPVETLAGVIPWPAVRLFPEMTDLPALQNMRDIDDAATEGREGFVLCWPAPPGSGQSAFRLKLKYAAYLRLHRLLSQCTTFDLWEWLRSGHTPEGLQEKELPDEFYAAALHTAQQLQNQFQTLYEECQKYYRELQDARRQHIATGMEAKTIQRQLALRVKELREELQHVLFMMLNRDLSDRDLREKIWHQLRPQRAISALKEPGVGGT